MTVNTIAPHFFLESALRVPSRPAVDTNPAIQLTDSADISIPKEMGSLEGGPPRMTMAPLVITAIAIGGELLLIMLKEIARVTGRTLGEVIVEWLSEHSHRKPEQKEPIAKVPVTLTMLVQPEMSAR